MNTCEFPDCREKAQDWSKVVKKWHCATHDPFLVVWPTPKAPELPEEVKKPKEASKQWGKKYFKKKG